MYNINNRRKCLKKKNHSLYLYYIYSYLNIIKERDQSDMNLYSWFLLINPYAINTQNWLLFIPNKLYYSYLEYWKLSISELHTHIQNLYIVITNLGNETRSR